MPRARIARFDHRGGVNSNYSEDVLQPNEMVACINGRLTTFGAVVKRNGTQRVHDTAIASAGNILGGVQWDAPSVTGQVVAIAEGNLYHKTLAATEFTEVAGTFSTSNRPWFVSFIVGANRRLYIADGTLRYWDGTSVSAAGGSPPSALTVAVYKRRLFATDGSKTVYWSAVADPTDWVTAGGQAPVETYDDEGLVGMAACGSSLLLFKENSIARYTGVTAEEIRIELDTEGISADIGCIAPKTIVRFEQLVFFLSDRGPYLATEAGVTYIGDRIADTMASVDKQYWDRAVAVNDKAHREIHLWLPTDSAGNKLGWFFNYDLNAWTGPHAIAGSPGYSIHSAWAVENADGTENVYYGGGDGFVRDTDSSTAKDDLTRAGTGGSAITMDVEYPPLFFGSSGDVKMLHPTQMVHADLKTSGSLQFITESDLTASATLTQASAGTGVKPYRFRPACRGRRPKLTLRDATSELVEIHGIELEAQIGRRAA